MTNQRPSRLSKTKVLRLIRKYGSAYKAAKALKVTPQAFYDRMERLGIPRAGYALLPGEPRPKCAKIAWFRGLVGRKRVGVIAKECKRSESAIRARLSAYRIMLRPPLSERVSTLSKLLRKHKTGYAVAKVLHVSPQAVYERLSRHGIK